MIVKIDANELPPITESELAMIKDAVSRPITFDEDCPELTDAELSRFVRAADYSHEEMKRLHARQGPLMT